MNPKISIIVPIYNSQKYLDKCINSILKQRLIDFELILVNDGSTDMSARICEDYKAKDYRIRVIHKKNGGLSSARNAGIEIAKSEYIGFVDSDDWIDDDMYYKLYESITSDSYDLAMCRLYRVGEQKSVYVTEDLSKINKVMTGEQLFKALLRGRVDASACSKLFSKKLFNSNRFPLGRYNEDFELFASMFRNINRSIFVNDTKYNYIAHSDSITSSTTNDYILHLIENSYNILNQITIDDTDLIEEAKSYHYKQCYIFLFSVMFRKELHIYEELFLKVRGEVLYETFKIIRNKYLNVKQKVMLLGISFFPKIYLYIYRLLKKKYLPTSNIK